MRNIHHKLVAFLLRKTGQRRFKFRLGATKLVWVDYSAKDRTRRREQEQVGEEEEEEEEEL